MTTAQLLVLLREARDILERYALFDDEDGRDDVAQICEKIDAVLSEEEPQQQIA
jgi:hypothetical protein